MIRLKRAYEPTASDDGHRILVDRLWPRGIRKEALAIEAWLKDVGPSTELRRWFHDDPERWTAFRRRYGAELRHDPAKACVEALAREARDGCVTLVFASKDIEHNNAIVLRDAIERQTRTTPTTPPTRGARGGRRSNGRGLR